MNNNKKRIYIIENEDGFEFSEKKKIVHDLCLSKDFGDKFVKYLDDYEQILTKEFGFSPAEANTEIAKLIRKSYNQTTMINAYGKENYNQNNYHSTNFGLTINNGKLFFAPSIGNIDGAPLFNCSLGVLIKSFSQWE